MNHQPEARGIPLINHEAKIFRHLPISSPHHADDSDDTDDIAALAKLYNITEDDVRVALGGLIGVSLIERIHGRSRDLYVLRAHE